MKRRIIYAAVVVSMLAVVNEHGAGAAFLNLDITPEEDVLLDTAILGDSVRIDVHAN